MFHVKRLHMIEKEVHMDRSLFIENCLELFQLNTLPCTEQQAEQLFLLTERMLEVNKTMNLTAITDPQAIILRHYVDSITISEYIPEGARVLDVGCGAGFPTLPLAIFRPDLTITALDGTAKRVRYVEETAQLLGLSNVCPIAGRAEELAHAPDFRERFDVVTARAVASLPVLCELCLGFVRVGGTMIAMKAQQATRELEDAYTCIKTCGGAEPSRTERFLVAPDVDDECRNLIFISKTAHTSKIFPRHFSKISKKPL